METALVSGALANKPLNGGEAWVRLTWILALKRLGVDVTFVEEIPPAACVDSRGELCGFEASLNRRFFEQVVTQFGIADDACLIDRTTKQTTGLTYDDVLARAEDADLLFNLSGHLRDVRLLDAPRRRVYVDLDPGFTQLWAAQGVADLALDRHEVHLTVGERIGEPGCAIPTLGYAWVAVRPPVLLSEWSPRRGAPGVIRFTTLATWRASHGPMEHAGLRLDLKLHQFRRFIDLPQRCEGIFELALAIDPADQRDLDRLVAAGWQVVDPAGVAGDPLAYREYVQSSNAEFSVAQGMYVTASTGWFSDRTAAYLASGKPALVQDTGFDRELADGGGVVRFTSLEQAVEGGREIAGAYDRHSRAARAVAEQHLDSQTVLGRVLDLVASRS
jgi:hypothetical protein